MKKLLKKLYNARQRNKQKDSEGKLLPPPVRRLVFGEKTEREELKMLLGDLYDQLERLEEAQSTKYHRVGIEIEGKNATITIQKDQGAASNYNTRSRKTETRELQFTLDDLLKQDRNYLVESEAAPTEATVGAEKGTPPTDEEIKELEAPDEKQEQESSPDFESPMASSSKNKSLKDTIQNHNNRG